MQVAKIKFQSTKDPSYLKGGMRRNVAVVAVDSFSIWLQRPGVKDLHRTNLTPDLQMMAFERFWSVSTFAIFSLVASVFELTPAVDILKPAIAGILQSDSFRRGCELIAALNWQDLFDPKETTIPLTIGKSTSSMTESFVTGSSKHQVGAKRTI